MSVTRSTGRLAPRRPRRRTSTAGSGCRTSDPRAPRSTLRHGEHLDADGDLTTAHLDVNFPILPEPLPLGQVDVVVSAGVDGRRLRAAVHHARASATSGSRGIPGPLGARRRHRCRRALRPAAHGLVRVQRRAGQPAARGRRSGRCAATSCGSPHRLPAARARGLDRRLAGLRRRRPRSSTTCYGFTRSWLRDVAARPARRRLRRQHVAVRRRSRGSTARSAASTARPAGATSSSAHRGTSTRPTATPRCCARRWDAAVRVGRLRARAAPRSGRHPHRAAARPVPAPHEKYLWDSGFHWGEWLEPDAEVDDFGAFVGRGQVRGGDRLPAPVGAARRPRSAS